MQKYASVLHCALLGIDEGALDAAFDRIKESRRMGGTVYVAGNGGSAAIAEHLMCDFMKGSNIKVQSLVSNVAMLTAMANDLDYQDIFAAKLKMVGASSRDVLILVSSSGMSPNIVRAIEYAKELSIPVIGLSGFNGGILRDECDVSLHVPVHNYGVIEDAHQAIMHVLAQWALVVR